jgi:sulfur carrier protein
MAPMTQAAPQAAPRAATDAIRVNGQDEPLVAVTLAALIAEKAIDVGQRGIAVALNGAVIPRAAWPQTPLRSGDSIEIVRARQGG